MSELEVTPLMLDTFLVKEHVGMFKASNNYDIYDPESGAIVMQCREEKLGTLTKLLRFTDYKRMTPFNIVIKDVAGKPLITVKRGMAFVRSTVEVFDETGVKIGQFKQKAFSVRAKFMVQTPDEQTLCELKGKFTGWDFTFGLGDDIFARVTKKWQGIGRELFTSADNYVLTIDPSIEPDNPLRQLIVAAVMCIDMVLKE